MSETMTKEQFMAYEASMALAEIAIENERTLSKLILRKLADDSSTRDIDTECHHTDVNSLTASDYRKMYEENPYAARATELLPQECWQVSPLIYETDNLAEETDFERDLKQMCRDLNGDSWFQDQEAVTLWQYLKEADVKCGIGSFSVILLGINDGKTLDQPVDSIDEYGFKKNREKEVSLDFQTKKPLEKSPPKAPKDKKTKPKEVKNVVTDPTVAQGMGAESQHNDQIGAGGGIFSPTPSPDDRLKLIYIRVFDECDVSVVRYEMDRTNPRYGRPILYRVRVSDTRLVPVGSSAPPSYTTMQVHWSRIVHIAEGNLYGRPRMKQIWHNLEDIKKVMSGSAEMYWQGALPGISFETHPQLGGDVKVDSAAVKESMANYREGLQRHLLTMGLSTRTLAPQVVDPSPQISAQVDAICVKLACPKRKFMGSELGELASSQDDSAWNDRLRERQNNVITPKIIVPLIDRLIALGVLSEPEKYHVHWPGLETADPVKMAEVSLKKTQAMVQYASGDGESFIPLRHFLTKIMGFNDEETRAIIEEAMQQKDNPDLRISQDPREKQAQELELKKQEMEQKGDMLKQKMEGSKRMNGKGNDPTKPTKAQAFVKK